MLAPPLISAEATSSAAPAALEAGLSSLIEFCASDKGSAAIDFDRIKPVVDFIRQAPEMADYVPEERETTKGSFIGFTVQRPLPDLIRYAYNRYIPEGAIYPSSVNFSYWKEPPQGNPRGTQDLWKNLDGLTTPYVARGEVREAIAPDLHTGTYYEYDLRRAFIAFRQGHSRVVFSLSSQIGSSEVGKKGYIVGSDQDWNYLYTQDQGLNKTGLGWVKPKIFRYYSICCFLEDETGANKSKIGVFQWLAAGWIGMNVVDTHHIRRGLQRFADQFKGMVESERMPDPATLERVCKSLVETDESLLREKAVDVTRYIRKKAEQDEALRNKPAIQSLDETNYVAQMGKPQLVTVLMREFMKYCLGKETPLSPTFWAALSQPPAQGRQPVS
ncbi:MAG: hypothetical protein M0036_00685 [Desulfobacteraceae bacterium]|nr:hypothetical protein [Desulfobacteraceae bacterium]